MHGLAEDDVRRELDDALDIHRAESAHLLNGKRRLGVVAELGYADDPVGEPEGVEDLGICWRKRDDGRHRGRHTDGSARVVHIDAFALSVAPNAAGGTGCKPERLVRRA